MPRWRTAVAETQSTSATPPVTSGARGVQCRKLCPEGLEDEHRPSVTWDFHDRAPVHGRLRESHPLAKRLNPSALMHTTILQTQCWVVYLLVEVYDLKVGRHFVPSSF